MSHDNISDIRKVLYGDLNPPPQSSADYAYLMSEEVFIMCQIRLRIRNLES